MKPIIHLATDHAGFALKERVASYLKKKGYRVVDHGAFSDEASDYPDFMYPAARAVARSKGRTVGIFFGGSGLGECIVANKVRGIRAVAAYDDFTARKSREHNDANVLCIGARTTAGTWQRVKRIIDRWLATPFSKTARHVRRIKKIETYEKGGTAAR